MSPVPKLRICFAYDCLYPWTVGGAERWMTALARRAAEDGHSVTYITRRQWDDTAPPEIDGVQVIAVSRHEDLYDKHGRRTMGEPIRFGWGVYRHLRAQGDNYDIIHVHATPLFGALGAALAARRHKARVFVDWAEMWTRAYWTSYLGRINGTIAWAIQRTCIRMTQHAFIYSQLHAQRLVDEGLPGGLTQLTGLFDGTIESHPMPASADPIVVFAGRHIPEKGVLAIPEAIVTARRDVPTLRARILGDGPDFAELQQRVVDLDLQSVIDVPGFIDTADVGRAIGSATCLLLPSTREGYGLVVVEAAAKGTPSIVVAHPDNAAVELIDEGVNGFVSASQSAEDLAACIVKAVCGGAALRESTWQWAVAKGPDMTVARSMAQVLAAYETA